MGMLKKLFKPSMNNQIRLYPSIFPLVFFLNLIAITLLMESFKPITPLVLSHLNCFLLPEKGNKVGEFHLLDINLLPSFMAKVKTAHHYLTSKIARGYFIPCNKFDHKGNNGHHLLIAGSKVLVLQYWLPKQP